MSAGVHPYFVGRAMAMLRDVGADPRNAGELAAWAQQVWRTGQVQALGVLVDCEGHLVCETARDARSGAFYVLSGEYAHYLEDWAAAFHELKTGCPAMHVEAWQLCSGRHTATAPVTEPHTAVAVAR